ncbi:IQ motif and SEC7 domain-containing protein 1 isoform X1, partial [Tachysurus ichikawai]
PLAPRPATATGHGTIARSDWHSRPGQIQANQPDQHGSMSRGKGKVRSWGSLRGPLVVGGGTAERLEDMGGGSRTRTEGSKKKRNLLRLCYFHLRFPQV